MGFIKKKCSPVTQNVDFFLKLFQEKISGAGEDSLLIEATPNEAVCAVFDGCGGSGSRKYPAYSGKTGAYLASRAAAGALDQWFSREYSPESGIVSQAFQLKAWFQKAIAVCQAHEGSPLKLKGRMMKDFPTTAAFFTCMFPQKGIDVNCFWAGDSRCYVLTKEGLKQLTKDDLDNLDAMENLTADGVLTNVISGSQDFTIHSTAFHFSEPCLLFSATDGCFSYFSTPMEFEYLMLESLRYSESPAQWEENMRQILKEVAGDDFSMAGLAAGFHSFESMKACMLPRLKQFKETYMRGLDSMTHEEKYKLWLVYQKDYLSLL